MGWNAYNVHETWNERVSEQSKRARNAGSNGEESIAQIVKAKK